MHSRCQNPTTAPTRHDAIFYTLNTPIKNRVQEFSPIPTLDDETSCATHTDWALKFRETFLDAKIPTVESSGLKGVQEKIFDAHQERDLHESALPLRRAPGESLVDHMLLSLDQIKPNQISSRRSKISHRDQLTNDRPSFYVDVDQGTRHQPILTYATWNCRGGESRLSYSTQADIPHYDSKPLPDPNRSGTKRVGSPNVKIVAGMILGQQTDVTSYSGNREKGPSSSSRKLRSRAGTESKGSSFDLGRHTQSASSARRVRNNSIQSSSPSNGQRIYQKAHDGKSCSDLDKDDNFSTKTVYERQQSSCRSSPEVIRSSVKPSIPNFFGHKRSTRSNDGNNCKEMPTGMKDNDMYYTKPDGKNDGRSRSRDYSSVPDFKAGTHGSSRARDSPSSTYTNPSLESTPAPSTKKRPGLFRRVFGSSRNVSWIDNFYDHSPLHGSPASTETIDRPGFISSSIHNTPPNQTISQSITPQESMPSVTKKTSSFFRRRKKSMSNEVPIDLESLQPLSHPVLSSTEVSVEKMLPSPPISLQTVLHTYPSTRKFPIVQPYSTDQQHDNKQDTSIFFDRGYSFSSNSVNTATIKAIDYSDQDIMQTTGARNGSKGDLIIPPFQENFDSDRELTKIKYASCHPLSANPPEETRVETSDGRYSSEESPYYLPTSNYVTEENFSWSRSLPLISRQNMEESLSSIRRTHIARQQSEDWVKITQSKAISSMDREDRVWLEPSSDEEEMELSRTGTRELDLNMGCREFDSISSVYESVASLPGEMSEWEKEEEEDDDDEYSTQSVKLNTNILTPVIPKIGLVAEDSSILIGIEEHQYAKKIFDGNEGLVSKDKAAAWLGEEDPFRSRVLRAYMDLYSYTNLNILAALRLLCGRLVLKAESQQVDRILVAFSRRWSHCNPFHGFKATDVVHTICYSLLLLNTDLHLANIEQKMTRSQFIKNAMPTIRKVVTDAAPEAFDSRRPSILPGRTSAFDQEMHQKDTSTERPSVDVENHSWINPIKQPIFRREIDTEPMASLDQDITTDDSGPLVSAQFRGSLRTWEVQVEIVLKNFYNSIRNEPLPLFGSLSEKPTVQGLSSNPLSLFARTPSVISHTLSDTQSYRSRAADTLRPGNRNRLNKNRSRPGLYPIGPGVGSSRTSLDDQTPMWSPVSSSSWSKYSLGKTPTSISMDSLGSSWQNGDFQQSIGFANALSQAIIREETTGSSTANLNETDETSVTPLFEDESLELHGAPWAKEGLVKHKHHLESLDKKSKERNWNEVFAVVEKGYLSLFSFSSKSMRQKSKNKVTHGVVGGGNWQENAENLGSFLLRQTIASALPSPGYSKARPHVWALSLPTGAVHLFQVGTLDIVKEFVSTTNYWSARMSNHPLVGGISNVEYGWSDAIMKNSLATSTGLDTSGLIQRPTTSNSHRPSYSGRSSTKEPSRASIDQAPPVSMRSQQPGDKVSIADWVPPTQNMRPSSLNEKDQLNNLTAYVSGIEEELQKHNKLRSPMLLAFSPRHVNAQKAMANWEKKSAYLLREIVKFRTYIDALQVSESMKHEIYAEREKRKKQMQLADLHN